MQDNSAQPQASKVATEVPETEKAQVVVTKTTASTDMHIKLRSPFHVYYDDRANSISALNDTGPFDILPGHRNFMTLVSPCELVLRTASGDQRIKIARAVMHVKADHVTVFLDV